MKENIYRFDYLPLFIVISYISFTYILHLIMIDLNENSFNLLLLIFTTILCIVVGYALSFNNKFKNKRAMINEHPEWKLNKKIQLLILISMLITILISINSIISYYSNPEEMEEFIYNPGQSYGRIKYLQKFPEQNLSDGGFGSIFSIILTLLSGAEYIYLILSIIFWKKLNVILKYLFWGTSLIYAVKSLLIGSMITIGAPFMVSIPLIINTLRARKNKFSQKGVKLFFNRILTLTMITAVSFLIVFFIANRTGEDLKGGVDYILYYVSHGYEGLEQTFDLDFQFTYGFTTFRGITDYFVKYLGAPELFEESYLYRNEIINGWPALAVWSTIFPWLASDFTYFFTPFIIGIVSYFFGKIWNDTMITKNPFGYLLLGQFFIFWFMVPANNQLFHTLGNASSLTLIIILYILKSKFNDYKKSTGENNA